MWLLASNGVCWLERCCRQLCFEYSCPMCPSSKFSSVFFLQTQETREILHFHYTTWPDFGVPESPASFLNFLFKVRESGSLNPEHGPVVVHCSAGIGRSGTFCLVDTCLLLVRTTYSWGYAIPAQFAEERVAVGLAESCGTFCRVLLHGIPRYLTLSLVWECIPRQILFLTGRSDPGEGKPLVFQVMSKDSLCPWG